MLNDPIITDRTIFARNCVVRKIPRNEADKFLEDNHIYGSASCRYCYGLFVKRATGAAEKKSAPDSRLGNAANEDRIPRGQYDSLSTGEPVAVACFSNARRWEKNGRSVCSYEWVRYASVKDSRVAGGMGKLLAAFIEDRHPDDVMTYAISTVAPWRQVRTDLGISKPEADNSDVGVDSIKSNMGNADFGIDSGKSEIGNADFGNAFRKLGFVEESRMTFPSRLVEGEMSVSIKFRLKLTY